MGVIGAFQDGLCTLLNWVFARFLYGWFEEKSKSFSQNFLIGLERGLARGGGQNFLGDAQIMVCELGMSYVGEVLISECLYQSDLNTERQRDRETERQRDRDTER